MLEELDIKNISDQEKLSIFDNLESEQLAQLDDLMEIMTSAHAYNTSFRDCINSITHTNKPLSTVLLLESIELDLFFQTQSVAEIKSNLLNLLYDVDQRLDLMNPIKEALTLMANNEQYYLHIVSDLLRQAAPSFTSQIFLHCKQIAILTLLIHYCYHQDSSIIYNVFYLIKAKYYRLLAKIFASNFFNYLAERCLSKTRQPLCCRITEITLQQNSNYTHMDKLDRFSEEMKLIISWIKMKKSLKIKNNLQFLLN